MGSNGEPHSSHSASGANSATMTPSTSSQFLKSQQKSCNDLDERAGGATPMECDYESEISESSICSSDHNCHEDADDEQSDWPDVPTAGELNTPSNKCSSGGSKYKPFAKKGLHFPVSENPFLTLGLTPHSSHHSHGHNSQSIFSCSGYSSKRRRRMHQSFGQS